MKRILVTIIILVAALYTMAEEYISFKGIPIEGSMTEFCQKLKTKGFTPIEHENNMSYFSGDFMSRKATVVVSATADGKNVLAVVVCFDPSGEWRELINTYDYCKNLYIRKYGRPTRSHENNPSRSDSNTALMSEVYNGTVTYDSTWEITGGTILLTIGKSLGFYEGMVSIGYANSEKINDKIQHDLDDI